MFRKDIFLLKSDFMFILGKVAHSSHNYEEAFKFYEESIKLNSVNYSALFCMSKV